MFDRQTCVDLEESNKECTCMVNIEIIKYHCIATLAQYVMWYYRPLCRVLGKAVKQTI